MRATQEVEMRTTTEIEPPSREVVELWLSLQELAVHAIKIAELEISGIRDGNGMWGGDVLGGIWTRLRENIDQLEQAYVAEWKKRSPDKDGMLLAFPSDKAGDPFDLDKF
jgi:hypothetical protein